MSPRLRIAAAVAAAALMALGQPALRVAFAAGAAGETRGSVAPGGDSDDHPAARSDHRDGTRLADRGRRPLPDGGAGTLAALLPALPATGRPALAPARARQDVATATPPFCIGTPCSPRGPPPAR